MYGTSITIVGNVVDDVINRPTQNGLARTSFRVASTQRRKDRDTGQWVDGHKFFVNVTCWRELAENVALSLKKGDPVLVTGRIYSRQYLKEETSHVAYEVDPESIGHDLARGTSAFAKRRRGMSGSVELDADHLPVRLGDQGYELVPELDEPGYGRLGNGVDGSVSDDELAAQLDAAQLDSARLQPTGLGRAG